MINADQRRQALERPTIIIDEMKYEGRLLSWEEWTPFVDKLGDWFTGRVKEEAAKTDIQAFLTAVFNDVTAAKIMKLEPAILEEAIVDFFNCHRRSRKPAPAEGSAAASS